MKSLEDKDMNDSQKFVNGSDPNRKEIKFFETADEKEKRLKSVYVTLFTLFIQSLGSSIIMTGIWPYLIKLNSRSTKEFYSLIVAVNPLAQFLFSPLIGYWTNKLNSIKIPIVTTLIIFIASNGFYSSLNLVGHGIKYWMLIIRFVIGAAGTNQTVCTSYISSATLLEERTKMIAMASLAQITGLIVGALLQALLTLIGDGFEFYGLDVNMFTAVGWVNAVFGLVNIAVFYSRLYKDHDITAMEQRFGGERAEESTSSIKLDQITLWTLIFSYFIVLFNMVVLESLLTPISMDQFALSHDKALSLNSILIGMGAIVSVIMLSFLPRLTKFFKEIDILIWGCFLIEVIGKIMYIPYGNDTPKIAVDKQYINNNGTISFYDDDDLKILGCPVKTQPWCEYSPALGFPEYIIGFLLGILGFPIGVTLIQSLFTKALGTHPKGTWVGILCAVGSISRIIGPIIIMTSYTSHGLGWSFGWITIFMALPMALLYLIKNRIQKSEEKRMEMEVHC